MSVNDTLANILSSIKNAEKIGKREIVLRPTSKLNTNILSIMNKRGYIGEFEIIDDNRGGIYKVNLLHKINNCGVIKPRFPVKKDEVIKYEQRYLPAEGFGIMIISTPEGLLTHYEVKKKRIGGKLIAFVY